MLSERSSKNGPIDIYRDTYLRYFGYLGPFSVTLSRFLPISVARMACASYFVSDMHAKLPQSDTENYKKQSLINGIDVTIFHFVSSLALPVFVSRSIKNYTKMLWSRAPGFGKHLPGVLSLAFIPIVGRYIDNGTNYAMEKSYRSFLRKTSNDQKFDHEIGIFDEYYDEDFGRKAATTTQSSSDDQKNEKKEKNKKTSKNENNYKNSKNAKRENEKKAKSENVKNAKNDKNYSRDTDESQKSQKSSKNKSKKSSIDDKTDSADKRSHLNNSNKVPAEKSKYFGYFFSDTNKDTAEKHNKDHADKNKYRETLLEMNEERRKERSKSERDPNISRII